MAAYSQDRIGKYGERIAKTSSAFDGAINNPSGQTDITDILKLFDHLRPHHPMDTQIKMVAGKMLRMGQRSTSDGLVPFSEGIFCGGTICMADAERLWGREEGFRLLTFGHQRIDPDHRRIMTLVEFILQPENLIKYKGDMTIELINEWYEEVGKALGHKPLSQCSAWEILKAQKISLAWKKRNLHRINGDHGFKLSPKVSRTNFRMQCGISFKSLMTCAEWKVIEGSACEFYGLTEENRIFEAPPRPRKKRELMEFFATPTLVLA